MRAMVVLACLVYIYQRKIHQLANLFLVDLVFIYPSYKCKPGDQVHTPRV